MPVYAIRVCIWVERTWPRLVTARQLDQSAITCLEFRGKAHHIWSQISLGEICSFHFTQGCSGHLENQKLVRVGFGRGARGGYGAVFSRIGKGREGLLSINFFLGGIRNVSFSQCSAATWDSVIDCGGARWQWIVSPCSHLPDWANAGIRVLGA